MLERLALRAAGVPGYGHEAAAQGDPDTVTTVVEVGEQGFGDGVWYGAAVTITPKRFPSGLDTNGPNRAPGDIDDKIVASRSDGFAKSRAILLDITGTGDRRGIVKQRGGQCGEDGGNTHDDERELTAPWLSVEGKGHELQTPGRIQPIGATLADWRWVQPRMASAIRRNCPDVESDAGRAM